MENICKHLGVCGSCKLHTLNYEEQLFFKIDQYQPLFNSFLIKRLIFLDQNRSNLELEQNLEFGTMAMKLIMQ